MVTINKLAENVMQIAGKKLKLKHIDGPLGVRGRNPVLSRSSESCSEHSEESSEGSDNKLIKEKLDWAPSQPLREGLAVTYGWIEEQVGK